jgi:hypothetical protein
MAEALDFSQRAQLEEEIDGPCAYEDLRDCLRDLALVNRTVFAHRPILDWLGRVTDSLRRYAAPDRRLGRAAEARGRVNRRGHQRKRTSCGTRCNAPQQRDPVGSWRRDELRRDFQCACDHCVRDDPPPWRGRARPAAQMDGAHGTGGMVRLRPASQADTSPDLKSDDARTMVASLDTSGWTAVHSKELPGGRLGRDMRARRYNGG